MKHFARVVGEGFDADHVTLPCAQCGRDEYSCDCEIGTAGYPKLRGFLGGDKLTIEQAQDRIARVFLGVAR